MKKFLSIDQGTTSSRAIVFDQNLKAIKDAQMEYDLAYPNDGWVAVSYTHLTLPTNDVV